MICVSTHLDWMAFQLFANTSEVRMQFGFNRRVDTLLSVLCAENDMYVVLY
jgi:hypothetical protein